MKAKRKIIEHKQLYSLVNMGNDLTSPCRKNYPDKDTLVRLDPDTCLNISVYREKMEGYLPLQSAVDLQLGYSVYL
jgi:hypothetical protein